MHAIEAVNRERARSEAGGISVHESKAVTAIPHSASPK